MKTREERNRRACAISEEVAKQVEKIGYQIIAEGGKVNGSLEHKMEAACLERMYEAAATCVVLCAIMSETAGNVPVNIDVLDAAAKYLQTLIVSLRVSMEMEKTLSPEDMEATVEDMRKEVEERVAAARRNYN